MPTIDERRALIDLLPQFLQRRRGGWHELEAVLQAFDLERPEFFLLMAIVQELDPDERMSEAELRANLFNPYSTFNPIFDHLPALVAKEYLDRSDDATYGVLPRGAGVIRQIERAARDYVATLQPLPLADLERLATTLTAIADRLWRAPEPAAKLHGARVQRMPITPEDAPMVRLEHAIFRLWSARDDAHNAAWRAAGFTGPPEDLLTRVWNDEAHTIDQLREAVEHTQHPDDVQRGVDQLIAGGYLARTGDELMITARGQSIRDAIERETDRIYFTPWPELSPDEVRWLHLSLHQIVAAVV